MIPSPVEEWLARQGYGGVIASHPVGGGCINNGARLQTTSGPTFFLKTNPHAPVGMFEREVEGLEALAVPDGPRLPKPYLFGTDFLLLEDLAPAPRRPDYWPEFGRQLAALHRHTHPRFGFAHDNYLGSTPQPNAWMDDAYRFFAEQRLLYQARLAHRRGLLERAELRQAEQLAARLPDLIPQQPASLIHGDLWSGNAFADKRGAPALIDPAAHYGWAEAELAMTALFGGFPDAFYRAYEEARPLQSGYRQRFPLYNLYHLLNHLNLFGTGYLGEVVAILHKY
ncbi:MAG TPA: fructosamine kinase family protein [Anaerolineales bacterium]